MRAGGAASNANKQIDDPEKKRVSCRLDFIQNCRKNVGMLHTALFPKLSSRLSKEPIDTAKSAAPNMMDMQSQQMGMMSSQFSYLLTNGMVIYLLSGFVICRLPFSIPGWYNKEITQYSVELKTLDNSYVSCFVFFYIITICYSDLHLLLFSASENAMMEQMQMQMGGGMMGGGGADPKEVLNDQVDMLKDEGGKMDVIKREKYIFEHMKY